MCNEVIYAVKRTALVTSLLCRAFTLTCSDEWFVKRIVGLQLDRPRGEGSGHN